MVSSRKIVLFTWAGLCIAGVAFAAHSLPKFAPETAKYLPWSNPAMLQCILSIPSGNCSVVAAFEAVREHITFSHKLMFLGLSAAPILFLGLPLLYLLQPAASLKKAKGERP